jgi:arsenite-transporting ATPase
MENFTDSINRFDRTMHQFDTLRLAMFSGKGGVGKTTLSCGFARHWAQRFPHERILLLSTDPAHSLADVLQMTVTDAARSQADLPNLQVRALNAEVLLSEFKARYGNVLELLVERGSFVQGEDLIPVWDLSWPGLDELMSILEIQRLLREQAIDRVVVDMAPSGHTLSLFRLMDFLDGFLSALDLFQEKHRVVTASFTGRYSPDQADYFLSEMKTDLAAGRQLLQNRSQTACLVVSIAEPLSLLETKRFLDSLQQLNMPFGGLFVNRLLPEAVDSNASACADWDRYLEQQEMLSKALNLAEQQPVFRVPYEAEEPVGHEAIDRLIAQIDLLSTAASCSGVTPLPVQLPPKQLPSLSDFVVEGRRLLLVGGKGGVGKTTVAAAIAWAMASHHSNRNVRVISIDPAHSLGDALGTQLGHQPTLLSPNLSAQEINAEQMLEQFRDEYLWELAAMMSGESADDALQLAYTPVAWRQIVSQSLPGLDEMLSLIRVIELLEKQEQDLIILDTAPTGHLLRFLEMPIALGDWLAWIFKLWIKYQDVVGRTELMGRLRTLRQRVMQTQRLLKNPQYTEFIGVFRAQTAIVAEALRLTEALDRMGISQRYIVHNCFELEQDALVFDPTVVRLPRLPRSIAPFEQIKAAAKLLF